MAVFHYNDVSCQEWKILRNKLAKYEIKLKVVPAKLSSKVNNSCSVTVLFVIITTGKKLTTFHGWFASGLLVAHESLTSASSNLVLEV